MQDTCLNLAVSPAPPICIRHSTMHGCGFLLWDRTRSILIIYPSTPTQYHPNCCTAEEQGLTSDLESIRQDFLFRRWVSCIGKACAIWNSSSYLGRSSRGGIRQVRSHRAAYITFHLYIYTLSTPTSTKGRKRVQTVFLLPLRKHKLKMTLSTPYFSYGGCHDAKDYPSATNTQSGFPLPMDIYEQDMDFLAYSDKYVSVHPILASST